MSNDGSSESPTSTQQARAPRQTDANPKKATEVKRVLACGTCRKRKLKCDSKRPKCSTCARLGHPCEYDEVRKKSGPKRGYVKSLEARLNQLETLLDQNPQVVNETSEVKNTHQIPTLTKEPPAAIDEAIPELFPAAPMTDHDLNLISDFGIPTVDFSWDMVSLGLEEPLPSQDIMDELYQIYFDKVHAAMPLLHRPRFMASLNFAPSSRPPVCLRYIIFAHACSADARYSSSAEQFYQKARKYAEQDEMRGHGESFITVAHAQCWAMIAGYEFKHMYFPRAWQSVGRAGRLVQMLGLHRQDRVGLDVKQTLPPAKDWIEREERRRTFWVAYCTDRYASIGTGWPMMMDELDIMTSLPSSDQAFLRGTPEKTPMLSEVISGDGSSTLSSYGSVVLLATLFGRNLIHLHRPSADESDHDLNGEFWKRHRSLDNILLNTALSMPSHLRLPQGLNDTNVVFCNMNIHTSTICLHQAAIFKADKHKLASQISGESKRRCLVAADQITSIMRMISHQDLAGLNPFIAFCLYVAARVFVQYLKFKSEDLTVKSSLVFLLHAMQALKHRNPLTGSFLVQLDVDLEGSGLDIPSPLADAKFTSLSSVQASLNTSGSKCSPLFDIQEPQSSTVGQSSPNVPQTYDPTSYFTSSRYDDGAAAPNNHIDNGFTPPVSMGEALSSRSQSNHPTPSGSSNARVGSVDASLSPQSSVHVSAASNPQKHNTFRVHDMFSYNQGQKLGGVVMGDFDMNLNSNTSEQPETASNNDTGAQQNFMDFNFGSTGMTPGPTGFTPGPSGSGMTPGNTGMTPFTDWQNMPTNGNNEWM